jgi:hypothetical protein
MKTMKIVNESGFSSGTKVFSGDRDITKDVAISRIEIDIVPGNRNRLTLQVEGCTLEVSGVPVLALRKADGTVILGRFICDDGREYP